MVVPISLFEIHWYFSFQHKIPGCDSLYRSLWLHCHLHYECPRARWIIFVLEIIHLGKSDCITAAQFLATYSADRISLSNSVWQKVQSDVKRSKYLKSLTASGQAFGHAYKRGMGNSDREPASERYGWQHSTGQAFPFSLTSFKLWIHLLIYWRNSMDTNYIEDSWQKSFKRTN